MNFRCPHFRTGVALTFFLALLAIHLNQLTGPFHLGPLSIALLIGMLAKIWLHIPEEQQSGVTFSARNLLRIGTVLIGVHLNFTLLLNSGASMLLLSISIVISGLFFITWLGRQLKLPSMLSLLIAIDSSICGGSAVAAVAPTIGAQEEEIALVIPLCSLIGMAGMLALSAARHFLNLAPTTFGLLAGSTLHEVAQVMAAVSEVPAAMDVGTVAKLMRVTLLAPAILILTWVLSHKQRKETGLPKKISIRALIDSVWFVFGFLLIGGIHTLLLQHFSPAFIEHIDQQILTLASFLMAMAMAGVGLQVNFHHLQKNGLRAIGVALFGWLFLVAIASIEIHFMKLS